MSKALDGATKTLGMKWNSFTDLISYAPEEIVEASRKLKNPTKRDITKISSRLFDPMGLLAPVSLTFKLIFQELWEKKLG